MSLKVMYVLMKDDDSLIFCDFVLNPLVNILVFVILELFCKETS